MTGEPPGRIRGRGCSSGFVNQVNTADSFVVGSLRMLVSGQAVRRYDHPATATAARGGGSQMSDHKALEAHPSPLRTSIRAALAAATVLLAVLVAGIAPAGAQDDGPPPTFPDDLLNDESGCVSSTMTSTSCPSSFLTDENGIPCDPEWLRDHTVFPGGPTIPGTPTCPSSAGLLVDKGVGGREDAPPWWLNAYMAGIGLIVVASGLVRFGRWVGRS
jgi:hypothetical protein